MKRLTDKRTAEALKRNAEGLTAKGFDVPIDDLRYIKLAEYENEEERKECTFMNDNTCVCCGEQIPEGRQICPKCEKDDDAGMKLVFDEESGTWGEAPEVYGVINCPTKEDYEYVLNAIKAHKQLEDKHWNECRQIAHYEDELRSQNDAAYVRRSDVLDLITEAYEGGSFTDYSDYSSLWDAVDDMPGKENVDNDT